MPRGVAVSRDLRMAIINMYSLGVPTVTISRYTGVSRRAIQYFVAFYNKHGTVKEEQPRPGRKRKLSYNDIKVSWSTYHQHYSNITQYILTLLDSTPDIQLSDIAKHLRTDRNVEVDISTIWRGLVKKAGWTLKCVSPLAMLATGWGLSFAGNQSGKGAKL